MFQRPDILWIVTTQWRAQACGYAGDPNARTPTLDALATRAIDYSQAVTPHPFGPFARAAMLTGIPSPENGVRDYFDPLPPTSRTIAHDMHDRGYETAWFGKWHLAERDPAAPLVGEAHAKMIVPPDRRGGFNFWEGFESGFLLNDPWLSGTRLPSPARFPGYQSDLLCGRAAAWLRIADRPWFSVISLEPPHPPYAAPAAGIEPRDPASLVLRPNVPRGRAIETRARYELAGYYAHIEATDRAIGRLIAAVPPETLVVFTSVHGDMHGSHGLFRKGWPHEESVRVPLLVRLPNRPAGVRSEEPVSLIDLPDMTRAWSEGVAWNCPRDHAAISMPSVVNLPDQCDRVWRGLRTSRAKTISSDTKEQWLEVDLAANPFETGDATPR